MDGVTHTHTLTELHTHTRIGAIARNGRCYILCKACSSGLVLDNGSVNGSVRAQDHNNSTRPEQDHNNTTAQPSSKPMIQKYSNDQEQRSPGAQLTTKIVQDHEGQGMETYELDARHCC